MNKKKKCSTNYSLSKIIIGSSRGSLKITEKNESSAPILLSTHIPTLHLTYKLVLWEHSSSQAMSSKRKKKNIDLSSEVRQE